MRNMTYSSWRKMPFGIAVFVLITAQTFVAQQNVFWRTEAANGNWSNGGCAEIGTGNSQWWYQGFSPNNSRNQPDCWDGSTSRHNVEIGNNHQTTMTVNANFWGLRALTIAGSASASRTFNSSPDDFTRGIGLTSGLYNHTNNNATHTFNVRLGIDAPEVYLLTDFANNNTVFNREIFGNNNAIIFQGDGNTIVNGVISGNGARIEKQGNGLLVLNGNNTYSGSTRVNEGTLRLAAAERINNASDLILAGGTFSTGENTGFSETLNTLQILGNTTIALGTGNHNLIFAASNNVSWTVGRTLTITGWTGTAGQSGTAGKVFFGNNANGLTTDQLAQISFGNDFVGATILSTGEVVPLGALPVTLTALNTSCQSNHVHISWTTASEYNASHFNIEMSRDGFVWNNIGEVEAAGTTNQTTNYQFNAPNSGALTYFRLVQVDLDGASEIYGPISSLCEWQVNSVLIFPNPASSQFTLDIKALHDDSHAEIQIIDMMGKLVYSHPLDLLAGTNQVLVNNSHLQAGTYLVQIGSVQQHFETTRLVVR